MSRPPYRELQILLRILSLLLAVGGLFMIFAGKPLIVRVFLRPPEPEVSTLLLFVLKEMGGFVLMLTLMLFLASRDPVRNAGVSELPPISEWKIFAPACHPQPARWLVLRSSQAHGSPPQARSGQRKHRTPPSAPNSVRDCMPAQVVVRSRSCLLRIERAGVRSRSGWLHQS